METYWKDALKEFERLMIGQKNNITRPSWDEYKMLFAILTAIRSSSLKRHVGAVIATKDHRIVATGYNGAPSGCRSELELGYSNYEKIALEEYGRLKRVGGNPDKELVKEWAKVFSNEVHAEENAFDQVSSRGGAGVAGCDLYVTNYPCPRCAIKIVSNKIHSVFYWKDYIQNNSLTYDERRASEHIFAQTNVAVKHLPLSEEQILKTIVLMLSVGERTNYQFPWKEEEENGNE